MIQKFCLRFLLLFVSCTISFNFIQAQNLDHEVFLQEMKNSNEQTFLECLNKFDEYLKKFPDDLSVHIEKCRFIQFAQYDDYEEINPNQAEFDSCVLSLAEKFPNEPEVFIFQASFLWGEALIELFEKAENLVNNDSLVWSNENLAVLYSKISQNHFWDAQYIKSYDYILKAINQDNSYKSSLEYVKILAELDRKEEALEILLSIEDTTTIAWQLSQRADLFLRLEAYSDALELYRRIDEIDSSYNNNYEISNTLERVGEYDYARSYLLSDTSQHWDIRKSILVAICVFILFRIVTTIYVKTGVSVFDIDLDTIANIHNVFLSSKEQIAALVSTYGKVFGFLTICIIVPIYEEIIFRGVILDACQRYINFNSANIIQSILFATIHLDLFLFPVFFLFGMIAGGLRKKSDGLLSGIVFLAVNNSLAISLLLIR